MNEVKELIKKEVREFLPELILRIGIYKDKDISEADTRAKLIDPLFERLGWDILGEEIIRAYIIQPNFEPVDYLFKIGDEPCLLIEAKKLNAPITIEDVTKMIEYGNVADIKWCVLTNGNEIKVYNTNWPEAVEKKLFFELSIVSLSEKFDEKFDTFFDTLWLLTRESVMVGELDKEGAREYAKRVVLEIWSEDETVKFLCDRAKFKKLSDNLTRQAIKELKVVELFPFPAKPPEELVPPPPPPPVEEIPVPAEEVVLPSEEITVSTDEEEVIPLEEREVVVHKPTVVQKDLSTKLIEYIKDERVRESFKTTVNTFRKLAKDVVEELYPKSMVYKVEDKNFVKLKPFKSHFQISIFNPSTNKWLSFDMEKGNLDRLKDRINKAKQLYKEIRKK